MKYSYGDENSETSAREKETRTTSFKSWAKQTEESYQLQLALATRLSSQAALTADTNLLDFSCDDQRGRSDSFSSSPEFISHRFWVTGCVSYCDRIPDGFYVIHGMDPYTWTISTDQRDTGLVPSFEMLKAVDPCGDVSINVIFIDRFKDIRLKELCNRVIGLSSSLITTENAVEQLAHIVCSQMGGIVPSEGEAFGKCWKECTKIVKSHLGSIVLPLGSLSVGLCVHRALLFKVLADFINLPCRIAKGCQYCERDVSSSCLVRVENDREYVVDLFAKPGALKQPDSSINCTSSVLVSSPLSHPRFKPIRTAEDFRMLAKLFFFDHQLLNLEFDDTFSGTSIDQDDKSSLLTIDKNGAPSSTDKDQASLSSLFENVAWNVNYEQELQTIGPSSSSVIVINPNQLDKDSIQPNTILPSGHRDVNPISVFSNPSPDVTNNLPFMRLNQFVIKSSSELHLEEEDLDIQWSELVLKEKIGAGSFGTVHLADWRGSDVAVKILVEQDFDAKRFKEFLSEVKIMKRMRHPNIVLFMGAVTQPPNLSIVTEYLSRGSLHKLLHMPDAELMLDERRRLNMAYDVASGMNYLHQLRPPIVHRDLKSLNLLVDSMYTVKVCDFGLSRSKPNTFLSSKTAGGTPEWMAPEVLRNEPSNEKSDIYSFGVILWELVTLQHPWRHLSQAQVVAAVGFQGQRLEVPSNIHPSLVSLIEACLANEPSLRPSFSYIMETLQKLIKSSTTQPLIIQAL